MESDEAGESLSRTLSEAIIPEVEEAIRRMSDEEYTELADKFSSDITMTKPPYTFGISQKPTRTNGTFRFCIKGEEVHEVPIRFISRRSWVWHHDSSLFRIDEYDPGMTFAETEEVDSGTVVGIRESASAPRLIGKVAGWLGLSSGDINKGIQDESLPLLSDCSLNRSYSSVATAPQRVLSRSKSDGAAFSWGESVSRVPVRHEFVFTTKNEAKAVYDLLDDYLRFAQEHMLRSREAKESRLSKAKRKRKTKAKAKSKSRSRGTIAAASSSDVFYPGSSGDGACSLDTATATRRSFPRRGPNSPRSIN
jgi:hypothetical protein